MAYSLKKNYNYHSMWYNNFFIIKVFFLQISETRLVPNRRKAKRSTTTTATSQSSSTRSSTRKRTRSSKSSTSRQNQSTISRQVTSGGISRQKTAKSKRRSLRAKIVVVMWTVISAVAMVIMLPSFNFLEKLNYISF